MLVQLVQSKIATNQAISYHVELEKGNSLLPYFPIERIYLVSYDIFLHIIIHFKRFTLNMYTIEKFLNIIRYALETD